MRKQLVRTSKFLSRVLRHDPGCIGLELDASGWAVVDELLSLAKGAGREISRSVLEEVVETNEKKRFAFSPDGRRIRASQGHSLTVDLGLEPTTPDGLLFHGTAEKNLPAIASQGLLSRSRQHVHLSADRETAHRVGARHGTPVVLIIRARAMEAAGHLFFLSENGVWLTSHVGPEFIDFPRAFQPERPAAQQGVEPDVE